MKNLNPPLISCCFIVISNRFLQNSIEYFLGQTYPNKELIIVFDENQVSMDEVSRDTRIRLYPMNNIDELNFDSLFSQALKKTSGEYICLWQANTWYHAARLEYQLEAMLSTSETASMTNQTLIYDLSTSKIYVSSKEFLEFTLFFSRKLLNHYGKEISTNNFSLRTFSERLIREEKIYFLNDVPNLSVSFYQLGSKNHLISRAIQNAFELKAKDSKLIQGVLEKGKNHYQNSVTLDSVLGNHLLEEKLKSEDQAAKIPAKIHLLCKNKSIPEKYKPFYDHLVELHPEWEINIYDDDDELNLVKNHFPELLTLYQDYEFHIQRLDIFRLIIVFLEGGFYLDMDVYCLKNLSELRCHMLVLGDERTYTDRECRKYNLNPSKRQIANYMFGSIPKHPFWLEVLLESVVRFKHKIEEEGDVLYTTGPWLLSDVYYKLINKYDDIKLIENKFRLCLKHCNEISCRFGDYAVHWHMGSWRWNKNNPNHTRKKRTIRNYGKINNIANSVLSSKIKVLSTTGN